MRVLLTGMSGVGMSTLVGELRRRGWTAYDVDDEGLSEPRPHGGWGWRIAEVQALLERHEQVFLAGCSEEQAQLAFDLRVLLTAPSDVILARIDGRGKAFGQTADERGLVLRDLAEVEPLLRRTADLVLDARLPVTQLADLVLALVQRPPSG